MEWRSIGLSMPWAVGLAAFAIASSGCGSPSPATPTDAGGDADTPDASPPSDASRGDAVASEGGPGDADSIADAPPATPCVPDGGGASNPEGPLVIDSLDCDVTAHEVQSFLQVVSALSIPTSQHPGTGHNYLADGTGGTTLEAINRLYEVTADMPALATEHGAARSGHPLERRVARAPQRSPRRRAPRDVDGKGGPRVAAEPCPEHVCRLRGGRDHRHPRLQ